MVIDLQFKDGDSFSEGLAAVRISVKGKFKWRYINMKGEFVIPPVYDFAKHFSGGRATVGIRRKYYYIDKTGNKTRL